MHFDAYGRGLLVGIVSMLVSQLIGILIPKKHIVEVVGWALIAAAFIGACWGLLAIPLGGL